jgi:tetratricopeptide (TPR) repeat protein
MKPINCSVVSVLTCWITLSFGTSLAWSQDSTTHDARRQLAIKRASELAAVAANDSSSNILVQYGDALLRGGQCDEAVKQFERTIQLSPESEPYLWQHGIALFFVGRFDDAAALFEKHRVVNPHDVENAAWHFLCVAKSKDVDQARKILLPAPGDARIPMEQVLQRLPGGDFAAIKAAVESTNNTTSHATAKFYGDLYIGLIADAESDTKLAKEYLAKAANTEFTHYMADVARVYSERLTSPADPPQ